MRKCFNEDFEQQFSNHAAGVITHQSYNLGIMIIQLREREELFKKVNQCFLFDSRHFSPANMFLLRSRFNIEDLNDV